MGVGGWGDDEASGSHPQTVQSIQRLLLDRFVAPLLFSSDSNRETATQKARQFFFFFMADISTCYFPTL